MGRARIRSVTCRSLSGLGAAVRSLALLAGWGCASSATAPPDPPVTHPMFLGADISALERVEQAGGVFRDEGKAGDAIAILRAHGSNTFRLRLFVSPNGQDVQVNDLDYTVRMATRVKAAGATLLLDIHYSDGWADPAHQETPAAWAALPFDSLERKVEEYTTAVIVRLRQAGALPNIVQIGNETDGGMLWPQGQLRDGGDSLVQWDRFTRLLKAGIRGVRVATVPGDSVRVLIHNSQGGSTGGIQWYFDHLDAFGVPYDLIGVSYYPWWRGALAGLRAQLQASALRYNRDILVVETAYPWRAGDWESMATDRTAMTWPVSQQGQATFLRDLVAAVAAVPGGRGLGVIWWYPEAIPVSGLYVWGGGALALFNYSGGVLPAASVFGSR